MPSGYMASAQLHSWAKEIMKVLNESTCAHLFCLYICVHLCDSVNLRVLNDGKMLLVMTSKASKDAQAGLRDHCETM